MLKHDVLPKLRAEGGYISPSATLEQLADIQSQLDIQQAKALEAYQTVSQYQSELEYAKSQVVSIQEINFTQTWSQLPTLTPSGTV